MAFSVRVNGEVVKEFTEQVTGVHLRTARGEASALGVSDVGAVDVVVDTVNAGDPLRLDVVEARARKQRRDMIEEGMVTGDSAEQSDRSLGAKQNLDDLEEEQHLPPSVDLSTGLDPNDPDYSDKVTSRIESFNSSGDAEAAVGDDAERSFEPTQQPPQQPQPAQDETQASSSGQATTPTNEPSYPSNEPSTAPTAPTGETNQPTTSETTVNTENTTVNSENPPDFQLS